MDLEMLWYFEPTCWTWGLLSLQRKYESKLEPQLHLRKRKQKIFLFQIKSKLFDPDDQ